MQRILYSIAAITGIGYLYTAFYGQFHPAIQRSVLLVFAMVYVFSFLGRETKSLPAKLLSDALSVATCISMYFIVQYQLRSGIFLPQLKTFEVFWGGVFVLCLLEATRRSVGMIITVLVVSAILFAYFGRQLPGLLRHPGFDYPELIDFMAFGTFGIFGGPLAVVSTVVVVFIIFGAVFASSKAKELFFDLPYALFGGFRGGPAKMASISSGLFGSLSGSPTSNVVATGSITIPMMVRLGYSRRDAGAVETVASTGGILMPPVMGAVAFLMADVLGVSYAQIVVAAVVPGILYYVALLILIDGIAVRNNIKGIDRSERPKAGDVLRRNWIYTLPIVVLIGSMFIFQYSAMRSGLYAILAVLAVQIIDERFNFSVLKFLKTIAEGVIFSVQVVIVCGAAGIIIGTITMSGVGVFVSMVLVDLAMGNLFILLVLTMVTCIILGMGLPTSASYLFLAILVAPAIIKLGVDPMAAHLFIVYFATAAAFTPPVAIVAFAAAAIANEKPMAIAFSSLKLGFAIYIIPFLFVYNTSLILQDGNLFDILTMVLSTSLGLFAFASLFTGVLYNWRIDNLARAALAVGAACLFTNFILVNLVGLAILVAVGGWYYRRDVAGLRA